MSDFRVAKWGNSLAVRLPADLVRKLDLQAGDSIDILEGLIQKSTTPMSREEALARIAARRWKLPPDWKFDREEANAR